MASGVKAPVALQVNCSFLWVAMHELSRIPTGQSRAKLGKQEPSLAFQLVRNELILIRKNVLRSFEVCF